MKAPEKLLVILDEMRSHPVPPHTRDSDLLIYFADRIEACFDAEPGQAKPLVIRIDAFAYPDSGVINGVIDPDEPTPENPAKRPFLVSATRFPGEWRWQPRIDVDAGVILDWPKGTVAAIYDKPSDDCAVYLGDSDADLNAGEYVPSCLSCSDDDDYLVMRIDGEGRIAGWNAAAVREWLRRKGVVA